MRPLERDAQHVNSVNPRIEAREDRSRWRLLCGIKGSTIQSDVTMFPVTPFGELISSSASEGPLAGCFPPQLWEERDDCKNQIVPEEFM